MTLFPTQFATACFLASIAAGAASAQDVATPCGEFQVYPNYVSANALDVGEEGVSLGDTRFVHISLANEDGAEVAQFIHTAVVVPGGKGDFHNLLLEGHLVFLNGTLGISGLYSRPNLTSTEPAGPPDFNLALHSGTGDFVGYTGQVQLTRNSEDQRVYLFDIPCP